MIKIGVTACFFYPDKNRLVFGHKTLTYLEKDMSTYLARPGVMPILIPDLSDELLMEFVSEMDGIVLQGGNDIAPQTYGETPIENNRWPGDPHRDAYEMKIIDIALAQNKPVLGICRGFQVLNVYFGGTMYQDLQTQLPETRLHRDAEVYDQLTHEVEIVNGTLLEDLFGSEHHQLVNTIHHQGVKDLGKELQVMAYSREDGVVEAFTWKGAPAGKVMGVQWHPEFFANYKGPAKLMEAAPVYDTFLSFITKDKEGKGITAASAASGL
jgi:putative glutamine amidotransferase